MMTSQVGPYLRFGHLGNGDMESTFACYKSSSDTELAMWVYAWISHVDVSHSELDATLEM